KVSPESTPTTATIMDPLKHHGDSEATPGLRDLAVNVRQGAMPGWLGKALKDSLGDLARYPVDESAKAAVAGRHGRRLEEGLLTAGAAQAFTLVAQAFRPRRPAVVVPPQFPEPEAALRAAGHPVHRIILPPPFVLKAEVIPHEADLVVLGNPTNPTSVLHP